MKQVLFSVFLIVFMSMAWTKAYAYDIAVKNADGVTIYYNYISDGKELEVTRNQTDYYRGNIVIPEDVTYMDRTRKVTSIGGKAFYECSGMTLVTIPIISTVCIKIVRMQTLNLLGAFFIHEDPF